MRLLGDDARTRLDGGITSTRKYNFRSEKLAGIYLYYSRAREVTSNERANALALSLSTSILREHESVSTLPRSLLLTGVHMHIHLNYHFIGSPTFIVSRKLLL